MALRTWFPFNRTVRRAFSAVSPVKKRSKRETFSWRWLLAATAASCSSMSGTTWGSGAGSSPGAAGSCAKRDTTGSDAAIKIAAAQRSGLGIAIHVLLRAHDLRPLGRYVQAQECCEQCAHFANRRAFGKMCTLLAT